MRHMSFLNRAARAAGQAKGQLDEVRAARSAASVQPVDPPPLSEHEAGVLAGARARGLPDPTILLTAEEASGILGTPLGGPALTYGDDSVGVRYAAQGDKGRRWEATVVAYEDPSTYLHVAEDGMGEPVDGIGDAALYQDPYLFVIADELVFHVEATTPAGTDPGQLAALAECVVARTRQ
jgi:hypothetical protein